MGIYNETFYRFSRPDGADPTAKLKEDKIVEQFEQPWYRRASYVVLAKLDEATWGVTNYGQPLDRLLQWLHERRCDDDCVTGQVWRRTVMDAPPMPLGGTAEDLDRWHQETGVTTEETYCGRDPLEVKISIRLYKLSQRDRRTLARVPG